MVTLRISYIVQRPILTPLDQGHSQVSSDSRLYKRGACPQAPTMYKRAHPATPWARLKGVMGTSQFTSYSTLQPGVTDLGPPTTMLVRFLPSRAQPRLAPPHP